jgi:hypothetical protein|nr:MAG TPA: hypothetical protein [Caudoviricetes sp.]
MTAYEKAEKYIEVTTEEYKKYIKNEEKIETLIRFCKEESILSVKDVMLVLGEKVQKNDEEKA